MGDLATVRSRGRVAKSQNNGKSRVAVCAATLQSFSQPGGMHRKSQVKIVGVMMIA